MTPIRNLPAPPSWSRVLLQLVLPCNTMRDSILGDLHEEFLEESHRLGAGRARIRYHRRTAGIVAHALTDYMLWREWMSDEHDDATTQKNTARPGGAARSADPRELRRVMRVLLDVGVGVLALSVLALGIAVNTVVFSAVESGGAAPWETPVYGVGSVLLLVACAWIAARLVCAGPRMLRSRRITLRP